jgi:arsenate reductase-like glutaredoxin family protein
MAPHSKGKGVKPLSPEDKASIIDYRDTGMATSEIASWMDHDRATIKRALAAWRAFLEKGVPPRKKASGRKKKLTDDLLVMLKRQIKKYPAMTAGHLRESLPELAHLADHTIQHALQKHLKMPSRVAALKPLLTEKMKKRRMAFCNKYKSWKEADWSTVMYSDESMFRCIRAMRSRVRRPIGSNHYDSRFTVKT